jgi:hypothetical protein
MVLHKKKSAMECSNEMKKTEIFEEPKNILFSFKMYTELKMNEESSVSKTTNNGLDDRFISGRDEDFPLCNHIQTTSRFHLASFPMVIMD